MGKRINLYCMFIICIVLLMSCNSHKEKELTIFYLCGTIESHRHIECTKLDSICKTIEYDDTIYVNAVAFKQIEDGIRNAKPVKNSPNSYNSVMYVNAGDMNLCINGIDNRCWVKQTGGQYHSSVINDKTAYLLKWKSHYYNFLPHDVLVLDKEIRQYGIPYDYRENQVQKPVKKKEVSKVLLKIRM